MIFSQTQDIQIQFEKSLPTSEITKNPCYVQKKFHSKPLTNGQMTYKFKKTRNILTKTTWAITEYTFR